MRRDFGIVFMFTRPQSDYYSAIKCRMRREMRDEKLQPSNPNVLKNC